MNIQRSKLKHVAILLAGISAASISAMAHANWSIKRLDGIAPDGIPIAINDSGQVVINDDRGSSFITGPYGVGITKLGDSMTSSDINDSGQVAG